MTERDDTVPVDETVPEPLWRRALSLIFTLVVIALIVFMWPSRFGGSTRIVIVAGDSMEPTYSYGDVVVTRGGGEPEVGDAVVFAVPEGTGEGSLVIHRVHEMNADGTFVTQGDNRDTPDQWSLTADDVVGEPLLHVPRGGHVVWFLQQWMVLAVVVGVLVLLLLWPSDDDEDEDDEHDDLESLHARYDDPIEPMRVFVQPASVPDVDLEPDPDRTIGMLRGADVADVLALDTGRPTVTLRSLTHDDDDATAALERNEPWSAVEIDQRTMDDAVAWLDAQLEVALEPSAAND